MKNARPAFTLLEVTLVVGILAIMLSLTLLVSYNAITSTSLRAAENILVQTMRRAQVLSQNNVNGSQWGVYICDTASLSAECSLSEDTGIVLYERDIFTSFNFGGANDQLFEINPQIIFSGPLYGSMDAGAGLTFQRLSGDPLNPLSVGDITITRNNEKRILTMNGRGVVDH